MSFNDWASKALPECLEALRESAGLPNADLVILRRTAREAWRESACEERNKGVGLAAYRELVRGLVKQGDILTHTRCLGLLEEHVYTHNDGAWLCGKPTRDTARISGSSRPVNDISPGNVTHINRTPVEMLIAGLGLVPPETPAT